MAHEITSTDGIFSVREMPWHGLGDVLDHNPTRAEAQALVHNWEPITEPVYRAVPYVTAEGPETRYEVVPGQQAVVRSDTSELLGVTADTYGIVTNNELWDVVEAVGNIGSDILIETGGSLRGGKDVWALLRLAEPLRIKGDPRGDTVAYLAFQNNHTAQGSFRAQAINTRIVCANTSAAADAESKKNGYEFTFRHSSGISQRIEEAKAAVAMWREGVVLWQNAMEVLARETVTKAQQEWFVQAFQPMPPNHLVTDRVRNNVETARSELRAILASPTQEGIGLTAFGLFQAGLEWHQHVRAVKGRDDRARMESHFRRSILTDDGLRRSTLALAQDALTAV